jgi:hypothetical protein
MREIEKALLVKGGDDEMRIRLSNKPKPKYDNVYNKWVVRNWDGSCAGIPNGCDVRFDDIGNAAVDEVRMKAVAESGVDGVAGAVTSIAINAPAPAPAPAAPAAPPIKPNSGDPMRPFAIFTEIALRSPAYTSGLRDGDICTNFGPTNIDNHNSLQGVASVVKKAHDDSQSIEVHVLRDQESKVVVLRPRLWEGRGLLGCKVDFYALHSN